jgi:hypothetical protein
MATHIEEPPSFPMLLRAMDVGETISRSALIPVGGKEAKNLNETLYKMRNSINQTVSKHRKTARGSYFRVVSAVAVTDDRTSFLATVAVTRTDEEVVDI